MPKLVSCILYRGNFKVCLFGLKVGEGIERRGEKFSNLVNKKLESRGGIFHYFALVYVLF